jgi:uncharacterized membrane protein YtjA (UPF0391 family)
MSSKSVSDGIVLLKAAGVNGLCPLTSVAQCSTAFLTELSSFLILKTGHFSKLDQDVHCDKQKRKGVTMPYAWVFLLMAMAAGILGFGLITFAAAEIARVLFFVFFVLFIVTVFRHAPRAGKTLP